MHGNDLLNCSSSWTIPRVATPPSGFPSTATATPWPATPPCAMSLATPPADRPEVLPMTTLTAAADRIQGPAVSAIPLSGARWMSEEERMLGGMTRAAKGVARPMLQSQWRCSLGVTRRPRACARRMRECSLSARVLLLVSVFVSAGVCPPFLFSLRGMHSLLSPCSEVCCC